MNKIYFASPIVPSGVSWLVNCFLELGINHGGHEWWDYRNGKYYLKKEKESYKKWLPALNRYESFDFRDDLEVNYIHDWPLKKYETYPIIFFVRDPRDALFSAYKRYNDEITFHEYTQCLDNATDVSTIDSWSLFTKCWLTHKKVKVARFEDYRSDAKKLLGDILDFLNIEVDNRLIEKAVEESTFEKAAYYERLYNQIHGDKTIINRSGKVGSWRELPDDEMIVIREIEKRAGEVMRKLGYMTTEAAQALPSYMPNFRLLHTLKQTGINPIHILSNDDQLYIQLNKERIEEFFWQHQNLEHASNIYLNPEFTSFMDNNDDVDLCIFGSGSGGVNLCKYIEGHNIFHNKRFRVIAFFDNGSHTWGSHVCGRQVLQPTPAEVQDKIIVIASTWYREIKEQLLKLNVKESNIIKAF